MPWENAAKMVSPWLSYRSLLTASSLLLCDSKPAASTSGSGEATGLSRLPQGKTTLCWAQSLMCIGCLGTSFTTRAEVSLITEQQHVNPGANLHRKSLVKRSRFFAGFFLSPHKFNTSSLNIQALLMYKSGHKMAIFLKHLTVLA